MKLEVGKLVGWCDGHPYVAGIEELLETTHPLVENVA